MRIKMLAMVSAALVLGAAAPPRPAPIEQLDVALHELTPNGGDFTLATIPADERGAFARARVDRIEVDPDALALVEDRQSARALAAMLLSYFAMPDPPRITTSPSRVGTTVAAAGAILLGTKVIDPTDKKDFGYEEQARPAFQLGWFPPAREGPEAGAIRASRMVAMLNKAGGCSGPLADVLDSAEKLGNREAADLARRVRKDLGRSIYPPDYSCGG
ncbi:hypothetical protein HNP52_002438 [Sphingomonas kyeonggiensis]|uniref:Uncharacterized protein n=1 Tax=Sphingomonas kyeonggiensis TaxID=1268553 RepID=A0A7W7K1N7_9SPHN|nr:hypothetical protein [Sphingomonas kyeonggiensis]MBB4839369.1 hypothetical protein [Sphingomonas kyeonggiensis]